jgi:hypothetical protein
MPGAVLAGRHAAVGDDLQGNDRRIGTDGLR